MKPANVEPHWVGSLKTLSTLSDSARERERESWLYTQQGSCGGNPGRLVLLCQAWPKEQHFTLHTTPSARSGGGTMDPQTQSKREMEKNRALFSVRLGGICVL